MQEMITAINLQLLEEWCNLYRRDQIIDYYLIDHSALPMQKVSHLFKSALFQSKQIPTYAHSKKNPVTKASDIHTLHIKI